MRVELTNVTRRYLIEPARIPMLITQPFLLLPAIPSRGWLIKYVLYNHGDDDSPYINPPNSPIRYMRVIPSDSTSHDLVTPMRADTLLAADASTHVAVPLSYEVRSGSGVILFVFPSLSGAMTAPLEVIIVADKLML